MTMFWPLRRRVQTVYPACLWTYTKCTALYLWARNSLNLKFNIQHRRSYQQFESILFVHNFCSFQKLLTTWALGIIIGGNLIWEIPWLHNVTPPPSPIILTRPPPFRKTDSVHHYFFPQIVFREILEIHLYRSYSESWGNFIQKAGTSCMKQHFQRVPKVAIPTFGLIARPVMVWWG